jgi:iron complex outermembrane recepter protein
MRRVVGLSLVCAGLLYGDGVNLGIVEVETTIPQDVVKDVRGEDLKSADTADALSKNLANVTISRRSGISNDITVRGQRKDNIAVTIDGAKVCGACPNRMDPPISHVLSNNIDFIEINHGPFDVETFGALTSQIAITTKKPTTNDVHGDINLNMGSWGYKKTAFTMEGGAGSVKFYLSASAESSDQYEDGDGNNFTAQIANSIATSQAMMGNQYKPAFQDKAAYAKQTMMAKLFWEIDENQELRLGYTANRSDGILYPSSPMDALYDDSDIYTVDYIAKNLGDYSKEFTVSLYHSEVDHPMSTRYRVASIMNPDTRKSPNEMTHALTTDMDGIKIKNTFDVGNHEITVGGDYSLRNWDGLYSMNGMPTPKPHSIWDVDTTNYALFVKDKAKYGAWVVETGLRLDSTEIVSANPAQQSNTYDIPNGFAAATYQANASTKYFFGVGRSSRVPDGKELYLMGQKGNETGTPTLEATINNEIDLGVEKRFEDGVVKFKGFYSILEDYIAFNNNNKTKLMDNTMAAFHAYENVDAVVYGFELSGSYVATESLSFDYGIAYQRGEKDSPLTGQTETNMPDIAPLKANLALNYDYDSSMNFRAEVITADSWSEFDGDNGEQAIDGYTVLNLKAKKSFTNGIELTIGVDNLLDETYAISNTYKDLTLLTGLPTSEVMLLNEPGRYVYANLRYKF